MREILFRAREREGFKRGNWLVGWPYLFNGIWLMTAADDEKSKAHVIDPKTINEWTGLCDMGGEKIFEGDRLSGLVRNNGFVPHYPADALLEADVVVTYSAEGVEGAGWYVVGQADNRTYGDRLLADESENWTVTGNIYDNPEQDPSQSAQGADSSPQGASQEKEAENHG